MSFFLKFSPNATSSYPSSSKLYLNCRHSLRMPSVDIVVFGQTKFQDHLIIMHSLSYSPIVIVHHVDDYPKAHLTVLSHNIKLNFSFSSCSNGSTEMIIIFKLFPIFRKPFVSFENTTSTFEFRMINVSLVNSVECIQG